MRRAILAGILGIHALCVAPSAAVVSGRAGAKPLFRDFMGLNGHTVQFKPGLYAATCRLARDYHGMNWDVGKETHYKPQFPWARNRVNWEEVYGRWRQAGFEIDASIMFKGLPADIWTDPAKDARAYGHAFAKAFGPSSGRNLVASAEIGNEPGFYDDETYRTIFENMARGLRAGDPKIKIVTCNVTTGKATKYDKSIACIQGLEDLYDVLNIHVYAHVKGWPTWQRSFPEDAGIKYLKQVRDLLDWRDTHAPEKEVWITEFGWDASTRPAPKTGTFAKWVDVSDTQQAQYLVRSLLVFSRMDVARAYIYFFNDSDNPQIHGSSGLTRNYKPKPSFHAVAHLYRTLGAYRFRRARVERPGELYVYEYAAADPARRVVAVWSPTGSGRTGETEIRLEGMTLTGAQKMPLTAGEVPQIELTEQDGAVRVPYDESPTYLWLKRLPGGK